MTVHLRAELEELIRQDLERGPYKTLEEFVEHAIRQLHDQEAWFASHRDDIARRLEDGWSAANRGELLNEEQVRAKMHEGKRVWVQQRSKA
jgi:Arc/MetJ-type ribon-helix-helix transcriptional regulator